VTTPTPTNAGPRLDARSLDDVSAFVRAAGLVLDEITGSRVTGHIELGADHLTPWGIVHGGVYSTAVE
jgi:acyl-coenzyme A thioesterase PaaI-like protein